MRREVPEGTMIPKYYGVAWYLPEERWLAVCYPVPLNWIFGWARLFWILLRRGPAYLIYRTEQFLRVRIR